ncbi:MAG: hypothetical protein CMJ19_11595 [Phycisphaeraceae bacterium]|nr:hypothetical protein [Phycisphaeraceae bacterium]
MAEDHADETTQKKTKNRFLKYIFPWVFILIGLVTCWIGFRGVYLGYVSSSWPTATGQVVSSEVKSSTSRSNGKSTTTYFADIQYIFVVDNVSHSGTRVAIGDYGSSSSSHARGIVNRYPKGKQVQVVYMPDNPSECMLETGLHLQAAFLPVFGLIFLGVGVLIKVRPPKES